ncbi:hypothetical protein [Idiomarina sp.]|uniref:hypothetical protein n=1 Tax=Idiomarina sp. TaxID=1874361 RepID=UPI0025BC56CD|nr:hypothetical protein [Idiomarina sp.]|tara:strand:+ start:1979 stop:2140 length:162 start_codon:yes stop_codon:yes gene_type:complete
MSAQTIFLNRLAQAAKAIKSESDTNINDLVKRISQLADKTPSVTQHMCQKTIH